MGRKPAQERKPVRDREAAFVREYLVDMNATRAAERAGYSKRTARSQGSRLLTRADIQRALSEATKARAERLEVTADAVVRELACIAFADIGRAFDGKELLALEDMPEQLRRAVAAVEVVESSAMHTVRKVKTWDKVRALELLGKYLRLFVDQVENKHTLEVTIETAREQLRSRLMALASRERPRLPDSIPPAG